MAGIKKRDRHSEPRTSFIIVRYTETEKQSIEQAAAQVGIATSEYVRLAIAVAMERGIKIPKAG